MSAGKNIINVGLAAGNAAAGAAFITAGAADAGTGVAALCESRCGFRMRPSVLAAHVWQVRTGGKSALATCPHWQQRRRRNIPAFPHSSAPHPSLPPLPCPPAATTGLAGVLGAHMTASIGGADMPVVITLLNSYRRVGARQLCPSFVALGLVGRQAPAVHQSARQLLRPQPTRLSWKLSNPAPTPPSP